MQINITLLKCLVCTSFFVIFTAEQVLFLSFATAMQMKFIAIQDDVGIKKLC